MALNKKLVICHVLVQGCRCPLGSTSIVQMNQEWDTAQGMKRICNLRDGPEQEVGHMPCARAGVSVSAGQCAYCASQPRVGCSPGREETS